MIDGDGSFDFQTNTYYFDDGNSPQNTLMSLNLNTGAYKPYKVVELDSPVFVGGNIIGELGSNSSLAALNLASGKVTVIYPNPPFLTSMYTQVFDKATNSYIL